ncbi:MAG: TIGR04282 family arsenosugar biosynthesis glycosyltransferase [Porticoccaceae bacterium]|nr:TIGR04282 family arsenosugar biosynthesis glycosyltransferase [Porticoccaceae bacterium]
MNVGGTLSTNPLSIVIFAKAPLPGFAKTRLIPALGEEGAAALATKLLAHTIAAARSAHIGAVELWVTPNPQHQVWSTLDISKTLTLRAQGDGDLGQRMARAARRVIAQGSSVLLIGSDCPQLDSGGLQAAAQALAHHDCCLVPALDGGYTLLGLRHYHSSLFTGMPWSTPEVADITRERIRELGWSLAEFPPLADIDEPADLVNLPAHWRGWDQDSPRSKSACKRSPP